MNHRGVIRVLLGITMLAWAALPDSAVACAACFGRSDSPMAKGMNMGILTLLVVIMSVLLGIAVFFFYILRRAARLARDQRPAAGPVDLDDALPQSVSEPTP